MKSIFAIVLFSVSASSFAIGTEKLIKSCQKVGTEKVIDQAKSYGLKIDLKSIKECGVDNRPLNIIAKYVWFCGTTAGGEKEVRVLTQKPIFKDCF